ncbi:hypothetical protein ZWY2020_041686 [Hordeum vulgare]|nr:hypothetical protein ZWY2020_041686 [Hordeum vulgare]
MATLTSDLLRRCRRGAGGGALLRYDGAVPGFPAPGASPSRSSAQPVNPTYASRPPRWRPGDASLGRSHGAILQSAHAVEREFQVRQRSSSSALAAHLGSRSPIPLPPVGGGLSHRRWSLLLGIWRRE